MMKQTIVSTSAALLALSVLGLFSPLCRGGEPGDAARSNRAAAIYAQPFEPATHRAFLPLPAGAVEPRGWLRDWCMAAKNGYTGHMDDYDVAFKHAWAADYTMRGEHLNWPKGGWPYEGGGYWFDGLVRLGCVLHDDELIAQAHQRLGVIIDHMNDHGISFLWWLDRNDPKDVAGSKVDSGWPLWACGLLGRALVADYDASQDAHALKALQSGYAGDGQWTESGWGMSNPWPAYDTYVRTGDKEIQKALNALFVEEPIDTPRHSSWNRYRRMPSDKAGVERNDHGVHFLESTTPWALGYLWTGKREFLSATLAWQDLIARDSMQPSGVPVGDEFYGPTGAFRATETCDVAGYLWSQLMLLSVSGEGRLGDRAERAFFNAGAAVVSRDFKTHVYFQSPNRVVDGSPPCKNGPGGKGCSYKPTHYPLCCTASLNRIAPNFVMHMWMATYDNGLAAVAYGPCKVSALAGDGVPVEIDCKTDYPFNDVIDIQVNPARAAAFPLSFRIPGWCKNASVLLNGAAVSATPDANGFIRMDRRWSAGDSVRLQFPMTPTIASGHDANADGAPFASVSYGPLLFALAIADTKDANTPDPAAKWKYALDLHDPTPAAAIAVERQPMPAKWDWPLQSPLKLRMQATPIDWNPAPEAPRLPGKAVKANGPAEGITLVPYGCTKFRISMFPVMGEGE